jgi:hypothetical protein
MDRGRKLDEAVGGGREGRGVVRGKDSGSGPRESGGAGDGRRWTGHCGSGADCDHNRESVTYGATCDIVRDIRITSQEFLDKAFLQEQWNNVNVCACSIMSLIRTDHRINGTFSPMPPMVHIDRKSIANHNGREH